MPRLKLWYCARCGRYFVTPWVPREDVRCPNCGEHINIYRVDKGRVGRRWRTAQLIFA